MARQSPDPLPRPPHDLASRVFSLPIGSDPESAYEQLGAQTKEQILRMLPDDWSFDGRKVMDFGSGAGRTLRHFREEARDGEFWGVDLHGPSVEWMLENICPPFNAWQSAAVPPLALEYGTFDLIYTVSVFTHLTDESLPWLLELHRLLKPGGLLINSYMGRWNSEWFAHETWNEDRVGMNMLYRHRDWESGGPAVLISDWWLHEHWGRAFDVVETDPQFHNYSWVTLRKKDVKLTTEDLQRPGDDPREFAALHHNIRQLQREEVRELEHAEELHAGALREQAHRYEGRIHDLENRLAGLERSRAVRAARLLRRLTGTEPKRLNP